MFVANLCGFVCLCCIVLVLCVSIMGVSVHMIGFCLCVYVFLFVVRGSPKLIICVVVWNCLCHNINKTQLCLFFLVCCECGCCMYVIML